MTTETLIEKVREKLGTLNERDEQLLVLITKILQREGAVQSKQLSEKSFTRRGVGLESGEIHMCDRQPPAVSLSNQRNELNSDTKNRQIYLARKKRSRQKAKIAAIRAATSRAI
jgi:hypothetical protein